MTATGRLDGGLPELLEELAPARIPDYFDDLLRAAERTPQRPAWRSPERWLPMGVLARPAPLGLPSWRPLVVLALLLLALVVGLAAFAGARRPTLPAPPYGLAGNGAVLYSTADGEIMSLDLATGRTSPVVTGNQHDEAPFFSRDGRRFMFARVLDGATAALMAADADGGAVEEVLPGGPLGGWVEWSPEGDRAVIADNVSQLDLVIVDMAARTTRTVTVPINVAHAEWRPGSDQLVLTTDTGNGAPRTVWIANSDGSGLAQLPTAGSVVAAPTLSPDGRHLAYFTWDDDGTGGQGLLHVLDIETGIDRELARDVRFARENPQYSPDGRFLLYERYDESEMYRLAVLPVVGGEEVALGDPHPQMTDGAAAAWSPDGTQVLVTYRDDDTTWLLASDGSSSRRIEAPVGEMFAWQRVAP